MDGGEKLLLARALKAPRLAEVRLAMRLGRLPYFHTVDSAALPHIEVEGHNLLNLASNNYLGLSTDPRVIRAAGDATAKWGTGVTGSRLMNGTLALHVQLEEEISDFFAQEASLVFSTGYTANLGILSALLTQGDTLVVDEDIHASCHDGAQFSGADVIAVPHNSMEQFRLALTRSSPAAMCLVEGVYSMTGDVAPLPELGALCQSSSTMLVVDEAHAVGVLGATGRGAVEEANASGAVDAITFTFSKSLGGCGGAVVGSNDLIEVLRFKARPFIFTASNTPGSLAAALAALRILREHPGYVADVCERAACFADRLAERGMLARTARIPIISIPVGSDFLTVQAWKMLWNRNIFCNASVSPAVPQGRGSLRFSVMRTHTLREIRDAAEICADVLSEIGSIADKDHL